MQTKAPAFKPSKHSSDKTNEIHKQAHDAAIECCIEFDKGDYTAYPQFLIGALLGCIDRSLK